MNPESNQEQINNIPEVDDSELRMPETAPKSSSHKVLNIVIILLLLAILATLAVGLYLWSNNLNQPVLETDNMRPTAEENSEPESTNAEAEVETAQAVSTSDELDAIEADLDSTQFDDMDDDFAAIETEIDAGIQPN